MMSDVDAPGRAHPQPGRRRRSTWSSSSLGSATAAASSGRSRPSRGSHAASRVVEPLFAYPRAGRRRGGSRPPAPCPDLAASWPSAAQAVPDGLFEPGEDARERARRRDSSALAASARGARSRHGPVGDRLATSPGVSPPSSRRPVRSAAHAAGSPWPVRWPARSSAGRRGRSSASPRASWRAASASAGGVRRATSVRRADR